MVPLKMTAPNLQLENVPATHTHTQLEKQGEGERRRGGGGGGGSRHVQALRNAQRQIDVTKPPPRLRPRDTTTTTTFTANSEHEATQNSTAPATRGGWRDERRSDEEDVKQSERGTKQVMKKKQWKNENHAQTKSKA
uniref:Uncharacterized protein n=1 Tax=Physcomitrium patens TaxID=3218 RepID=A0A2K1IKC3_PHYPA|nr:hypothetical protein PHYPA_028407 [Physcomitrium patens]